MSSILSNMMAQVRRFHEEVTGMPMPDRPMRLDGDRKEYALDHLHEELDELNVAQTIEDQADALIDLIYVAMGRLLEMGLPPGPLFDEVHEANMRRTRAGRTDRSEFDASKPDGWTPPQLHFYCTATRSEMDWLRQQHDQIVEAATGQAPPALARFVGVKPRRPKILVLGHGRHGKDTVAEMLRDRFGLSFTSSSWFCAERVVMPYVEELYNCRYPSVAACYGDRHNGSTITPLKPNRAVWYDAITAYNRPDAASLGRAIFEAHDVYCGLRSSREFHAVRAAGLYDLCVWVDASGRGVPPEDRSSCTVEPWMADAVVDNSGDLDELRLNVDRLMLNMFNMEPNDVPTRE